MFHHRLKILVILLAAALVVLIARLAWMQIFCGHQYLQQAQLALQRQPQQLETVRGTIYDCRDRPLALDQPAFDLCLHYQLTKLYDQRFWDYQRIKYLRDNPEKTAHDAQQYLQDAFATQLNNADSLLTELAQICQVPLDSLHSAIRRINDIVYLRRTSRARLLYCRTHNQPYKRHLKGKAIAQELARLINNEKQRIYWIGNTTVSDMRIPQPALKISRETAFSIEQRIVGDFFASHSQPRPVTVRIGKARTYPYNHLACHLIGQIGPVPPHLIDLHLDEPPDAPAVLTAYHPGDRCGDWGLEYLFEPILRGRRGRVRYDIDGHVIERIEPLPGANVKTTLDIDLQREIQRILQRKNDLHHEYRGAAVVIDVPTGQVKAMVSVPTFDLNSYYQPQLYARINDPCDLIKVACNRALSRNYQPGSTIKPALLLGALEKGIVDDHTRVYCHLDNKTWPGPPHDIRNHGLLNPHDAIKKSCNFFFIKLAESMGSAAFVAWLKNAGFAQPLLAWPDPFAARAPAAFRETTGHLAPIGRELPSMAQLRFMAIGRGALDASLLQIANSIATIARDGLFIPPTLVLSPPPPQHQTRQIAVSLHNIRLIQQAMKAVVYDPAGTAYQAFRNLPWPQENLTVYGKTGSTDYSLFACFARAPDGRCLALAVIIEAEMPGSKLAAPIARDILIAASRLQYLPSVEPPNQQFLVTHSKQRP